MPGSEKTSAKRLDVKQIKTLIRSVLISSKGGVPAHRFMSDYAALAMSSLKPEKLGFKTVNDLLRSMPDVVKICRVGGQTVYCGVQNEETAHINELVSKQNTKRKKSKKSGNMSHHRFAGSRRMFFNPLMQPSSSRSRPFTLQRIPKRILSPGTKTQSKQVHLPISRSLPASMASASQMREARLFHSAVSSIAGVRHSASQKSKSSSAVNLSPVLINRIKSVLGRNPSGVFCRTLKDLYKRDHGVSLPGSAVQALQTGAKGVARVEEITSNREKRLKFFPLDQGDKQTAGRKNVTGQGGSNKSTIFNAATNEISIDDNVRNNLITLLKERTNGISFTHLRELYHERYDWKFSDSVLHGIECGQIKNVAKVEKRCSGNREFVTFFPLDHAQTSARINEMGDGDNVASRDRMYRLPAIVERKVLQIVRSNPDGLKLSMLVKIYLDSHRQKLQPAEVECIRNGCLETVDVMKSRSGEVIISAETQPEADSKLSKYPAVTIKLKRKSTPISVLPQRCLLPKSLHRGTITHVCDHSFFYIQIPTDSVSAEDCENIYEPKEHSHCQIKSGSHVIVRRRRGKVVSLTRDLADVYFVDYGYTSEVKVSELCQLPSDLSEIPGLAILCELDGMDFDDDQAWAIWHKVLKKYVESQVIIDVISTKCDSTNAILSQVHSVRCYAREKIINCEITEAIQQSSRENNVATRRRSELSSAEKKSEEVVNQQTDIARVSSDSSTKEYCVSKTEPAYFNLPSQFPCYRGEFGKLVAVMVTRILSPNKFFMIPVERLQHLHYIATMLTKYFSRNDLPPGCIPLPNEKGMFAAVCKTDGLWAWRRVEVNIINRDIASVYLVDLGQVACVPVASLRRLPPDIALIPKLAITGRLGGIAMKSSFQSDGLERFEELVFGRQIVAHFVSCSVRENSLVFDVSLMYFDDENISRCINDVMVDEWNFADYI